MDITDDGCAIGNGVRNPRTWTLVSDEPAPNDEQKK